MKLYAIDWQLIVRNLRDIVITQKMDLEMKLR